LKQKKALFCAGTEPEIVEVIFRLLGSPQGILLDQYKSFPDWEKISFNKAYASRLQNDFGRHFDVMGISLLERLLDLDPKTRIKASEALEHRYLTPESIPSPSS
jgi:serine/threonine protein kinase